MPSDNIELKAIYDSSRKPVESIKIDTVKVNGKEVPLINKTVTVKVGDTIEATAALTPDKDLMDERVLWNVMGTVGDSHTMLHFTTSGSGILSEPTASPVQLKALKVTGDSKLYLRATAYASKLGTDLKAVSDFIYVNIVADSEHVCEYEVTTVHPTCTLKGYTLYTCKDEECGKSYKTQFTESLGGHKDTNDDGLCDNINQNTGKACGFKLSAGGNDGFVGQKKIGKAELTVTAPVTGQKPANAAQSVTSEAYTVASTQWMTADGQALDPNGTFAPGTVYTVKVTLEAKDGYAFQLKAFSSTKILRPAAAVKATEFQINTVTVKPGNGSSKDSVNLIYTFTATGAGTVTPTGEYDFQVLNGTAYDNSTGTKIIDNNIETPVKVLAGTVVKVAADDMTSMGLYFDKWEVVSGGITLADENSATTTFTMPEEAVKVLAVYERRVTSLSINKTAAIITGDFGGVWFGDSRDSEVLDWLEQLPFTLAFVDGNHENYDALERYPLEIWHGGKVHRVRPHVLHLMRGQVFEIEGYTFFTMGGAKSHDIERRVDHVSWWAQELPSDAEYAEARKNLTLHDWQADYIITHCAPTSIALAERRHNEADRLTDFLEEIRQRTKYRYWLFGHYHDNRMIDDKHILLWEQIVQVI